jgi:transcription elongation factor GreA
MNDKPVYISKEGLEKMKRELEHLRTTKVREVAARIEKAKELGDLRENADYHDAKDEMAATQGRIFELDDAIKRAVVIEATQRDAVGIGSRVLVRFNDKEKEFAVVGSTEADPLKGRISNESPLGLALIGKKVGEAAEVKAPSGVIRYEVLKIS